MAIDADGNKAMGFMAVGAAFGGVFAGKFLQVHSLSRVAGEAGAGGFSGKAQFAGAVGIVMAGGAAVEAKMGGAAVTFFAGGDDVALLGWMPLMAVNAGQLCSVGQTVGFDDLKNFCMAFAAILQAQV